MLNATSVHHARNVLFVELNNAMVLLDSENEQYWGLNEVGARMWQLLGETSDFTAVQRQLLDEYEVDADTLREDLTSLVTQLLDAKLLETDTERCSGLP